MSWQILDQVEKYGKVEHIVKCKKLRFRPDGNTADPTFVRLGFPLYQILLSWKGSTKPEDLLKLKCSGYGGFPRFIVHYANGEKEDFPSFEMFRKFCLKRFTKELCEQIFGHFIVRIPQELLTK